MSERIPHRYGHPNRSCQASHGRQTRQRQCVRWSPRRRGLHWLRRSPRTAAIVCAAVVVTLGVAAKPALAIPLGTGLAVAALLNDLLRRAEREREREREEE
jgi:hypothetical protein